MYDFSTSVDRRGFKSEKWNEQNLVDICGNPNALPFWVADMDLSVSDEIKEALKQEADLGVFGYRMDNDLLPSFLSFMEKRHDTVIPADHVAFAQGMLHAIALAMNIFTKEGDRILLPYPSYHPFMDMIVNNKRTIVPFLIERTEAGFVFNTEEYRKTASTCQAVLFCSPHNPTGLVFTKEELAAVLETAKELDQVVFCDEIHADLAFPGHRHIPLYKANEKIGAKCITFSAASKSFNIAGEHCAFASFSHSDMLEEYKMIEKRLYLTSPGYSVSVMAENAYGKGMEYNRALCEALEKKAKRVESFIKENCPLLTFCTPQASFIGLLDCTKIFDKVLEDKKKDPSYYQGTYTLSHFFGKYGNVCMNDGTWFGEDYGCYVRFNYGCGDELLERGLEGLKKAYEAALSIK